VVATAIAKLLRQSRIKPSGKRTAVSLAGANVLSRTVSLSTGFPNEIEAHIRDTVRRYAIFKGDTTVNDFSLLNPISERTGDRHAVLAAVREEIMTVLVRTVMKAGVIPSVVDAAPLATARVLYEKHLRPRNFEPVLLVTLDPMIAHMLVLHNGDLQFMHAAPGASDVLERGSPELAVLVTKIQSVIDHCANETETPMRVAKVVICLRGNAPEAVLVALSEALGGIPVVLCTASSVAREAGFMDKSEGGVPTPCATGLALRAADSTGFPVNVNLLPERTVRAQALKKRVLVTANLAGLMLFLSLLVMAGLLIQQQRLAVTSQMPATTSENAEVPRSAQSLRGEIETLSADLTRMQAFIDSVGPNFAWMEILSGIASRIPAEVRLTAVTAEGKRDLMLTGVCPSQEAAFRFAAALQELELIRVANVARVKSSTGETVMLNYHIECQLAVPSKEREEK
jgi:Tfp pilus assembly protein PilN